MTDNEIIKALECCINNTDEDCNKCVCSGSNVSCVDVLLTNSLDLINRQKAEIERLENNLEAMAVTMRNSAKATRTEAHKEFAERLHEELRMYGIKDKFNKSVFLNTVDNVKKRIGG